MIIGLAAGDGAALLLGGTCVCVWGGTVEVTEETGGSIKYQRLH